VTAIPDTAFGTSAPIVPLSQAEAIARDHFGIAGTATALSSERDANFRIAGAQGPVLMKISNPAEPRAVTDLQTQILLHLAHVAPGLPVPRLLPVGRDGHAVTLPIHGNDHVVRMMTFLPGVPLAEMADRRGTAPGIVAVLAALDAALAGLAIAAPPVDLLWDASRPLQVAPLVAAIAEDDDRRLVEAVLDRWTRHIAPRITAPGVRRQMIHNDFNPCNLLMQGTQVTGVIDFGDAIAAPLVSDPGTAMAYLLEETADPVDQMIDLLRIYHATMPLHPDEAALLFDIVRARWAITVAISAWRATLHPDNRTYILRNAPPARRWLRATAALDAAAVEARLRNAVITGDAR
jgi:hydroxylysine kinase